MATSNYKCVYISNSAFKRLLDINNTNNETFYIVHYDDLIPGVNEPIIDVFLGKNRLSSIINLDTLPDLDLAPYLNANAIKDSINSIFSDLGEFDSVEEYKSLLADLETTLENTVDNLASIEPINSGVHFYLSLSEPRIALAKKGSFTQFDLKDVDVDGSQFSYNATKKQIGFTKTLWLTEGLKYEMRLSGTYNILEMTRKKLVIQKESMGVKTIYSFRRYR